MAKAKKTGKGLADIQAAINKSHGDRTLVPMSDNADQTVERIPTGVLAVDRVLGGGFPRGQMVELYGPHGSGKTSICMRYIAEAQKFGLVCLLDLEHAFDIRMATNSGIDVEALWLAQPESAEDAFEIIEAILGADDVSAVVIDSVAGLTPAAEIAGDFGDSHVGLIARLMSQALRKFATTLRTENSDVTIVWINQIREKIGVMGYGPKTDSTGGRGLKFWASTRLEVSRKENLKPTGGATDTPGHVVKVKTTKNRHAAPFQTTEFNILYDTGISNESTLLDLGVAAGLIKLNGAWYTDVTTGEQLGQGRPNACANLREDPETYERLLEAVTLADWAEEVVAEEE